MNQLRGMPELGEIAQQLATLFSRGVTWAADALENALPTIQKALDYLVNNGPQVLSFLGKLAAAFAAMKFAPGIETLVRGAGGLIFGSSTGGSTHTGSGGIVGMLGSLFRGGQNAASGAAGMAGNAASWISSFIGATRNNMALTGRTGISVKMLRRTSSDPGVCSAFWQSFKENLRQGSVIGLILFGLTALLAVDLWYFFLLQGFVTGILRYIICGVLALLLTIAIITGIFAFPLQSLFENKVKAMLQNALLLSLRYHARSLGALAVNLLLAAATVLSLYYFPLLSMVLILFGVGLWIFIDMFLLLPVLSKYLPPEEEDGPPEVFE